MTAFSHGAWWRDPHAKVATPDKYSALMQESDETGTERERERESDGVSDLSLPRLA